MNIVYPNKKGIKRAAEVLKKGGVIVYPTDTAYGLGGIFNLAKVINKILKIKKRQDKKFPLIFSSFYQVEKFFKLNKEQKKLAKKYWPGPLSIVVSKNFAVRVPKNKVARILARRVGKPLIATSANIAGQKNIYQVKQVIKEFAKQKYQPDLILVAGNLKKVQPSTLVKVGKGKVKVLRPGPVKIRGN